LGVENNINFNLINLLVERLKKPLPGLPAQKLMSPVIGDKFFREFKPSTDARKSAVLTLFHLKEDELNLLFTLRSEKISHSGQISFPGGRQDENETFEETALRETNEEIGIDTSGIKILGRLSTLFVPPSNSLITPVVGYIAEMPEIKRNSDEVQEIFSVPFTDFISEESVFREIWNINNYEIEVPHWKVHPTTPLWGATAMILIELIEICKEFIV
jgi:8-oxo-dGTP pyrophosphatase MutT (NUDIX family)